MEECYRDAIARESVSYAKIDIAVAIDREGSLRASIADGTLGDSRSDSCIEQSLELVDLEPGGSRQSESTTFITSMTFFAHAYADGNDLIREKSAAQRDSERRRMENSWDDYSSVTRVQYGRTAASQFSSSP
jgi:hypothetical protein